MTDHTETDGRLRAAVDASPSGVLMVDDEGRIVLVNREIERLFGYPREELLGRPVEMLLPQRYREIHARHRDGFRGEPRTRAMGHGRDLVGRRRDGSEVSVEVGLTPVVTEEGMFILSSMVDLTARHEAEAERLRLAEQLRQSQKMEAVGTLAGGIAHDFNNVLAGILASAELLLSSDLTDEQKDDVEDILAAATRGRDMIQKLHTFSRRQAAEMRPLSLTEIVRDVEPLLHAILPARIAVEVNSTGPDRVRANPISIHQVVMNLATNASQAMSEEAGTLTLEVEPLYVTDSAALDHPSLREGHYVCLAVRDTGVGIAAEDIGRVFEPFFTTKPSGAGTGLGLSLVRTIMREHGGAVEITSREGEGTVVRCLLPALDEEVDHHVP